MLTALMDRRWVIVRGIIAGLIIVALFATTLAANSHESWISRGGIRNTAGELCCGNNDCGQLIGGHVRLVPGGYQINADFLIEMVDPVGGQSGTRVEHVEEFVPHAETLPSPDTKFWRCSWGGKRRCFFAPPPPGT